VIKRNSCYECSKRNRYSLVQQFKSRKFRLDHQFEVARFDQGYSLREMFVLCILNPMEIPTRTKMKMNLLWNHRSLLFSGKYPIPNLYQRQTILTQRLAQELSLFKQLRALALLMTLVLPSLLILGVEILPSSNKIKTLVCKEQIKKKQPNIT
jgi:hypothetical protein